MILPQHHVLLFFPAPAEPAEATVTVAVGMLLAVFLPQQLQRQVAVLFQLLAYIKVVRLRLLRRFLWRPIRREQRLFQAVFVPLLAERPANTGRLRSRQILVHRALAGPDAARNLPLAEFLLEVQAQDLFDLSHGLSLSGQLRSALPKSRSSPPMG